MTQSGAVAIGYDARGNLTSSGGDTFGYSAENLLTSKNAHTLSYDPLMRLYQIDGTVRFGYDGVDLIGEWTPGGSMQRRYVHAPGTDQPIQYPPRTDAPACQCWSGAMPARSMQDAGVNHRGYAPCLPDFDISAGARRASPTWSRLAFRSPR